MLNKQKILIVINDLNSGGAQKSLSSFLKALKLENKLDKYDIDLLVADKSGIFLNDLPSEVNLIDIPLYFKWMNCELKDLSFIKDFSAKGIIGKLISIIHKRFFHNAKYGNSEFWLTWKKIIPKCKKHYDVAIAYMDGWPNYYVSQKVDASKKVLWVHNEYQKLGYCHELDESCYKNCDRVITISEECRKAFIDSFPDLEEKISILENIAIASEITNKAEEGTAEEFSNSSAKTKILSVGRLSEQKAFDLAIRAALKLKEKGFDFIWVILGEGPDRNKLNALIEEYDLRDCVLLPGVKANPYAYMKACDVFVQSSKFEGKSIVLDEAKILKCPIVVTDYKTVHDTITDKVNGLIVSMNEDDIASAVIKITEDHLLRETIIGNLEKYSGGNEKELSKYIELMYFME